jgi:hypothetical protein
MFTSFSVHTFVVISNCMMTLRSVGQTVYILESLFDIYGRITYNCLFQYTVMSCFMFLLPSDNCLLVLVNWLHSDAFLLYLLISFKGYHLDLCLDILKSFCFLLHYYTFIWLIRDFIFISSPFVDLTQCWFWSLPCTSLSATHQRLFSSFCLKMFQQIW